MDTLNDTKLSAKQVAHLALFFKRKKLSIITDKDFTTEQKVAWNTLHDEMQWAILSHFGNNDLKG